MWIRIDLYKFERQKSLVRTRIENNALFEKLYLYRVCILNHMRCALITDTCFLYFRKEIGNSFLYFRKPRYRYNILGIQTRPKWPKIN